MERNQTADTVTESSASSQETIPNAALTVDLTKVHRAVVDLHADFQRQGERLQLAQFDRLVLRRNFTPAEMVELTAQLLAIGVLPDNLTEPYYDTPKNVKSQEIDSDHRAKRRSPYALLTQRDEVELGRRIQLAIRIQANLDTSKVVSQEEREIIQRGRLARDRMIMANLRLIRFALQNLHRPIRSLDPWDLFQEGSIGLMRAAEKFDPELGLKFSTYAIWWIRQAIFRGLDDGDRPIRIPVHGL